MRIAASNTIHHFDCLKTLLLTISTALLSSCCPQPPSLFPSYTMFPGVQILVFWITHSLRIVSWISTPDLYTNSEYLHVYLFLHISLTFTLASQSYVKLVKFKMGTSHHLFLQTTVNGTQAKNQQSHLVFPFLSYSVIQPMSLKAAPSYLRESNSLC